MAGPLPLFVDVEAHRADSGIGPLGCVTIGWAENPADSHTDGAVVSAVSNMGIGGTGKRWIQNTAASKPIYRASMPELGGRPGFEMFDGTDGRLFATSDTTGFHTAGGSITAMTVLAWSPLSAALWPASPGARYWSKIAASPAWYPFFTSGTYWRTLLGAGPSKAHTTTATPKRLVVISRANLATGAVSQRINGTTVTSTQAVGDLGAGTAHWGGFGTPDGLWARSPLSNIVDGWLSDAFVARLEAAAAAYYGIDVAAPGQYWGGFKAGWLPQPEKYKATLMYDAGDAAEGATMTLANAGIGTTGANASLWDLGQSTAGHQPSLTTRSGRTALECDGVDDELDTVDGGGGGVTETFLPATTTPGSFALLVERRRASAPAGNLTVLSFGTAATIYWYVGTNKFQYITGTGGTMYSDAAETDPIAPMIVSGKWDGAGAGVLRIDGVPQANVTFALTSSPTGLVSLGAYRATASFWDGWIWAAMFAAGRAWSTTELEEIETVLMAGIGQVTGTAKALTSRARRDHGQAGQARLGP